jgi:predicted transcriptional regulator
MATRKELRQDMREQFGSFLTASEIGKYLGCSPKTASEYIKEHDLHPVMVGNRRKYSVRDLAKLLGT